jgi:arginyl-tRNA synthetase
MKQKIQLLLTQQLEAEGIVLSQPLLLDVPQKSFGHYATNVAFILAKGLRKNPKVLAEELAVILEATPELKGHFTATAVNGFINLTFTPSFLWKQWQHFCQGHRDFPEASGSVLLEYVSANPTGPLHIGHGRWAVLGDVLARMLRFTGQPVATEFYINDAGSQIQKLRDSVQALRDGQPIPEDGYHGHYVAELAKSDQDPVNRNLDHQKAVLSIFRVNFDTWFSEKSLLESHQTDAVLSELSRLNLCFEDSGALWFRSTQFGDDKDRVLRKSDGALTYFLGDLAYHFDKVQRGFSRLVNIWGADHHGYVSRVRSGVRALCGDQFQSDTHFKVILGQLVHLFRDGEPVRMSKRTGEMVTLEEVIDEIGVDATRYFLLEKSPDTHLDFDLTLAKTQSSDNPVYYVQYAHARLCGILRNMSDEGDITEAVDHEWTPEEIQVMWQSVRFQDEILAASGHLSPHQWVNYTSHLAKGIQLFYHACPILKADPGLRARRSEMVRRLKYTLGLALDILGISAPETM